MAPPHSWTGMLKSAGRRYLDDECPRVAAAIAYFAFFAFIPLLVIAIAIGGYFYGEKAAEGKLLEQISSATGPQVAEIVQGTLTSSVTSGGSGLALLASILGLLWAASRLFVQLQRSLNHIWGIDEDNRSLREKAKKRLTGFLMVLAVGLLLIASIVASSVLNYLASHVQDWLPMSDTLLRWLDFLVMLGLMAGLVAAIFRYLPDTDIDWGDVWPGAIAAALLMGIVRFAFAFYIAHSNYGSVYGAAGSIAILLLYLYISSQVLFLAAEFTQVYASQRGSRSVQT